MKSSSPVRALSWEFGRQHRWGWVAIAAYLLALVAARLTILATGHAVEYDDDRIFAATVTVPTTAVMFYLMAVFSYGFVGDLSARQSMYPARFFTLPVSTAILAGLPMLYGTAAVALVWVVVRTMAVFPSDIEVPKVWPALLCAAFLSWIQVMTWMPTWWTGLRGAVAVLLLTTVDVGVILAIHFKTPELVMVGVLAPLIPLAQLAARAAVARARRGDVPEWRLFRSTATTAARRIGRRRFRSAARAQLWFEWRSGGRSLPTLVAIVLPFELALLFIPGNDTPTFVFFVLFAVVLTPRALAAFAAATVSAANPHEGDRYGLTSFAATRPVTNGALISAKLVMAMISTLVTWLVVLIAMAVALSWSHTWPTFFDGLQRSIDIVGRSRTIALLVLACAMSAVSTWKQLVQGLWLGLTGRAWLVKVSVFLTLLVGGMIPPIALEIIHDRETLIAAWNAITWIPAVLVAIKMTAAAWIATQLYRSRALADRTLVTGAATWMLAVFALYGVFAWMASTPHIPDYWLLLAAILFVPLPRLAAAPLALAWNRHR